MSFNLYGTPPHKCSYLPDKLATTVFIEPKNITLYNDIYIPACKNCQACISVRVV